MARSRSTKLLTGPEIEKAIQDAILYYRPHENDDPPPTYRRVAMDFGLQQCYQTFIRRLQGKTQPRSKAHAAQQLLSEPQEKALADWLEHLSDVGRPLSRRTIAKKVERLTDMSHRPSQRWLRNFLLRNPGIRLGKPSGLDPKRAQAFNESVIERHFDLLRRVLEENGIPWRNVWNMDEKGIQRGGGRKQQAMQYFIPRQRRPKYKLRSPNLELVTVIECVSAAGESIAPGFIFAESEPTK